MKLTVQMIRAQVLDEMKRLELRMEFLRGQLAAYEEIEGSRNEDISVAPSSASARELLNSPAISIGKAIRQGMIALREFTKDDVLKWVRSTYPALKFSDRSWGRPIREMMEKGEVAILKPNVGNKTQAVYGLKKRSGTGHTDE
jgi:hypothetical protein